MEKAGTQNGYCRLAQIEDHPDILAIGDVFDGLDYVQHKFPHYMQTPNWYCFVLVCDGIVVGFSFSLLVDDGRSLVGGGLRVHPKYRGHHYNRILTEHANAYMMKIHPTAMENKLYTSFESAFQDQRLKSQPERFQFLKRRGLLSKKASMTALKEFLGHCEMPMESEVRHPMKQELLKAIKNPDVKRTLFPDDYIVVMWIPYGILPNNFSYIYDISHVIWSQGHPELVSTQGPCICLLSCVTLIPCQAGLRVDLDIYGDDVSQVKSHVYAALCHIIRSYPNFEGDVELVMYYPPNFTLSGEAMFQDEIKWKPGAWSRYTHNYMGRKKVPKAITGYTSKI